IAGRRLAKRPSDLRSPRIACSGRSARGSVSYFQSPTAPKSTASAAFASASVASGSGWPCASYAVPPTGARSVSKRRSSAPRTRSASRTISVPMPSPGRIAIFIAAPRSAHRRREPRLAQQPLGLERADLVGVAQGQPNLVETAEQAVLAKRLDLERDRDARRRLDELALEVDR